jgi:hypothetical protein
LDPLEVPASVKTFSETTIQAIKSNVEPDTIGIRFMRDGEGSKYIDSTCQIQFGENSNNNADCQRFSLAYPTPNWEMGDTETTNPTCSNPLGTDGGAVSQLRAMGLYDCYVCFDAWGSGVSTPASIWVR